MPNSRPWDRVLFEEEISFRRRTRLEGPFVEAQLWVAELEDGHTAVQRPGLEVFRYGVELTPDRAVFRRVPPESVAYASGARCGSKLIARDYRAIDTSEWLSRVGAPPHAKSLLAGRRMLAGAVDQSRSFTASTREGSAARWEEAPIDPYAGDLVHWRKLDAEHGLVRLEAWGRAEAEPQLSEALRALRGCGTLIFDLRANLGGSLVFACSFRDRFLRRPSDLGSIRFCIEGALTARHPIRGEPPLADERWGGKLVVLVDSMTFSASEDFLLGLQGLPHVTVVRRRTGGGSGRPRSLRMHHDWWLSISTALTFDRNGRCIEMNGITADICFDDYLRGIS